MEGALAADSLLQAPRRTSGTVAALMLSIALVIALGGISRASYTSILDWVATALNPDLFVTASDNITNRNFRFPASMGDALRRIPGIAAIQMVRSDRIVFRGRPLFVVSLEIGSWAQRARRHALEGNEEEMYRLAAAGQGVIISDNLRALANLHVHDPVEIKAPNGVLRLPVAGAVSDWSDQQGTIFIERSLFIRYWGDDSVNVFRVYLEKGVAIETATQRILDEFAGQRRVFVLTNSEVRRYILRLTDQWLGLTYSQIAVAVLVAVLGIVNSLTVSILDRRRELGVLRAVGGLRRQVRHTIWMEALGIAVVGLVLGLALGAINLHYTLEMSRRDISGMLLPYRYPYSIALLLVPIMMGAALLAALWPAEAAVRSSLVEALEYE
jgi:putative ABC transport system permease protein